MQVNTVRFGTIEVPDGDMITFEGGILGFEAVQEYALIEPEENAAIKILQAVKEPALAFAVTDPRSVRSDFRLVLEDEDCEQLKLGDVSNADVYCIVTVTDDPTQSTVNLQAPLVVNRENGRAKQVVQRTGDYPIRHRVLGIQENKASA